MINGLKSIRRERASLERFRVITESMMEDSIVNEAIEDMDPHFFESVSEEEIEEIINRLPESDEEDEQVEKILKSEDGMTIDDIFGINDDIPEE